VAFIVTMGWWIPGEMTNDAIAKVGDLKITRDEYELRYRFLTDDYKKNVQGEFKEEMLKQHALQSLIDEKMWTIAAAEMKLSVSEDEVRTDIMKQPALQQDGRFSPELYRRFLATIHKKPYQYEPIHKEVMLRLKAIALVRDSVALTPSEAAEAQTLMARQAQVEGTAQASSQPLLQDFLFQKQQRALLAFQEGLKAHTPVKIHKENL
jgi:SurA N-terminal domain